MKLNSIKKVIALVCLIFSNAVFASSQLCLTNECTQNFDRLLKYAKHGSPIAQYLVAVMYREGSLIEKDNEKAFRWMRKSAKLKIGIAEYELALMYKKGIGTEVNAKKYEKYLNLAIKRNVEKALLHRVIDRIVRFQNFPESFSVQEANRIILDLDRLTIKSSKAQLLLSRFYELGIIVNPSLEKAYELAIMSARRGNYQARKRVEVLKSKMTSREIRNVELKFEDVSEYKMLIEGENPELSELLRYLIKYIQSQGLYDGRKTGSRLTPCSQTSFCKVYKNGFTNGIIFDRILTE